jgi:hypothetical protein
VSKQSSRWRVWSVGLVGMRAKKVLGGDLITQNKLHIMDDAQV